VVANAARAIAEIITVTGIINTDFTDVYNTLSSGNVAILSVGTAGGEDRINASIHEALTSPLVNSDVKGAKRVLLQLYCSSEHPIIMQEFDHIHAFVREMGNDVEVQWGVSLDESLGENVRVTLIATGFEVSDIPGLDDAVGKKTVDEAIDSFYKDAASHPASATEEAEKTPKPAPNVLQDGELIIDLDDNLVGEKAVEFVPTITPERETNNDLAKQTGRPGIAGWMRGRR
jgi:cell division GTPase FtsZ